MGFVADMMTGASASSNFNSSTSWSSLLEGVDETWMAEFLGDDDDFGPEDSLTVEETFAYALLDNERNFTNIMEAMMIQEFQHYVNTGEEFVYESVNVKGIFGKFKAAVKKCWEKIKAFFRKLMAWFGSKFKSDEKWYDEHKDYFKKCDGKKLADFKMFNFESNNINKSPLYSELSKSIKDQMDKYTAGYHDKQVVDSDDEKLIKGDYDSTEKTKLYIYGEVLKTVIKNDEDWKSGLKEHFGIKEEKAMDFSHKFVQTSVADFNQNKKIIQIAYDSAKMAIKVSANELEMAEREVIKKSTEYGKRGKKDSTSSKYIALIGSLASIGNSMLLQIYNTNMSALKAKREAGYRMGRMAISKKIGDKNDAATSTAESVNIGGFFDGTDSGLY